VPLLIEAGTLRKTSDTNSALNSLIDSSIAAAVVAGK
jgi:hypothetical protein